MVTFSDIANINYNISHSNLKAVKALHVIAFGDEGQPRKTRKSLYTFSGFKFCKNSDAFIEKIDDVKNRLSLSDLIAVCHILDLDYSGSIDQVADRICSFMISLETHGEDDDDEDDDEEEDDDEDDNEDEDADEIVQDKETGDKERAHRGNTGLYSARRGDAFSLTFRDVEDTISFFDGKEEYPVRKWISDFEELAEVTGWNDLHKLLFAKKSLRGLAKLFIQSEKGIKTWSILKKKLIDEFDVKVSSSHVHKMLMSRKKRKDESVREYVLTMKEIGSRADVEQEVVIQYIIDGILDDGQNKLLLYGAKTYSEFKEKVKLYENVHGKETMTSQSNFISKKDVKKENIKKEKGKTEVCFNCGDKGHKSTNCPYKNRGTKCFHCKEFGHVASRCPKKSTERVNTNHASTSANVNSVEIIPKSALNIRIDDVDLVALFDTGSDICAIREDVFCSSLYKILLSNEVITIKGIGGSKVSTLGTFCRNTIINGEEFIITFHVIPTTASSFRAIIGNNVLKLANVCIREDDIVLYKKSEDNFLMEITLDEKEDEEKLMDLKYITSSDHRKEIEQLIRNYKPEKIMSTNVEMKLVLKTEEPIYQKCRRLSMPEKEEVDKQIKEWLDEGIIRPSCSDFASPIVLVKKKDGRTRICCDYRKLNKVIVKDRFPLPLMEDVLDRLQDAKVFSTLDLKNGFFHVNMEESSIKYTSFVIPDGQYEFLRCPFGLCNSPAVFQRFVNYIFRPLISSGVAMYYMDDIIIPSKDENEGIEKLKLVLKLSKDYGLEIKKKKCQFLKRRVEFLGFIIEDGKVRPTEAKTTAVRLFPEPTTCKQVQSFLGLTGYFRKFICSYSKIAKPLSDLLKKNASFVFGDSQRQAFSELKKCLISEPVLHIYRRGCETELHTDASKYGYGACLLQKSIDDSKFHPVYYMSKKTTPAEERYSSYELEVLAIIQAVKKFRVYLLGIQFKIITDCSAFQKTMDKKDLTTRVARWALLLEEYDYVIEHRRGSQMSHVDALSRHPVIMTLTEEDGLIEKVKLAQSKDGHISAIKQILNSGDKYEDYLMKHDIVYKYKNGRELLVIPQRMQDEIIRKMHENGHFSIVKTKDLIERDYYIPGLKEKVEVHIRNCVLCILGNRKEGKKEGFLHPIPKLEGPLFTYHCDHLGPISSTNKSYQYIFTVVDDFSKFTWLYPIKSITAKETINCLVKQQKNFGNPGRIITDKGAAFTSREFKEYCMEETIDHVTITTGVPRGNGQVERIHRTVIPVLTKLSIDNPKKWYKFVDRVQRILNSTFQRSIAMTPFEVLIGVKMRNKEDISIKELIEQEVINDFEEQRDQLRETSKKQILKVQEENRKHYNLRRRKPTLYKNGDLVAIKRTQFGPGIKVDRKFLGPYEVTKVKPNDRYDVVKVGNHDGPMRTSTCAEYMKSWIYNFSESEADSE